MENAYRFIIRHEAPSFVYLCVENGMKSLSIDIFSPSNCCQKTDFCFQTHELVWFDLINTKRSLYRQTVKLQMVAGIRGVVR